VAFATLFHDKYTLAPVAEADKPVGAGTLASPLLLPPPLRCALDCSDWEVGKPSDLLHDVTTRPRIARAATSLFIDCVFIEFLNFVDVFRLDFVNGCKVMN
jgi:hypothetical protein